MSLYRAGRDGCFFSNLNEKDGNGNFRLLKFKHHKIAGSEETVRAKGGLSNKFAASVIFKISLKFNFCENNPALTLSCNHSPKVVNFKFLTTEPG
jgi:hypothetical protein